MPSIVGCARSLHHHLQCRLTLLQRPLLHLFPRGQPTVHLAPIIDINIPSTSGETERTLQSKTNFLFTNFVLSSFLNTHILLWEPVQVISNLLHVLGGIRVRKQRLKKCWRAPANNFGLWSSCTRRANKLPPGAVISSNSCNHRAETNRLHDQLDSAEAAHYHMRHQLCIHQDMLASKKEELSALAADYFRLSSNCSNRASDTADEQKPKQERVSDFLEHCPFIDIGMKRMRIMVMRHSSVFGAVAHIYLRKTMWVLAPLVEIICLDVCKASRYFISCFIDRCFYLKPDKPIPFCFIFFSFANFHSLVYSLVSLFYHLFTRLVRSISRLGPSY